MGASNSVNVCQSHYKSTKNEGVENINNTNIWSHIITNNNDLHSKSNKKVKPKISINNKRRSVRIKEDGNDDNDFISSKEIDDVYIDSNSRSRKHSFRLSQDDLVLPKGTDDDENTQRSSTSESEDNSLSSHDSDYECDCSSCTNSDCDEIYSVYVSPQKYCANAINRSNRNYQSQIAYHKNSLPIEMHQMKYRSCPGHNDNNNLVKVKWTDHFGELLTEELPPPYTLKKHTTSKSKNREIRHVPRVKYTRSDDNFSEILGYVHPRHSSMTKKKYATENFSKPSKCHRHRSFKEVNDEVFHRYCHQHKAFIVRNHASALTPHPEDTEDDSSQLNEHMLEDTSPRCNNSLGHQGNLFDPLYPGHDNESYQGLFYCFTNVIFFKMFCNSKTEI